MTDEEMAEEYAKGLCKTCKVDVCRYSKIQTCAIKESLKQAYLAGAEFGYNKANEWHYLKDGIMPEENQEECEIETSKAIMEMRSRIAELEKENAGLKAGRPQWHEIESKVTPKREISKQYMPKENQKVMLKYHFYNDEEIHYSDGYYNAYDFEFHIPNNPTSRIICVIAWKEITLPALPKEG